MPKKIFTQELVETRRRERPWKRWKEEVERDLQVLVVVTGKNGGILFDRPKPTVGCSASGEEKRREEKRREEKRREEKRREEKRRNNVY
jgi:hypothetical protein